MAGHDDDMFDFFSQSQAHHEATSVDAAKYGFSQASSGRGGSGAGICIFHVTDMYAGICIFMYCTFHYVCYMSAYGGAVKLCLMA
ncbi:hypothetical protein DAI22_09g002200 [Oryza sativa Japonica Group]|nr:hypothetical protein DAI22_09g002200 [Oryza sativa Japonica Group]